MAASGTTKTRALQSTDAPAHARAAPSLGRGLVFFLPFRLWAPFARPLVDFHFPPLKRSIFLLYNGSSPPPTLLPVCSEVVAKTPGNRCGRILDCIEVRVESYPKTKIGRNESETDVSGLETYRIITLQTGDILKVEREFPSGNGTAFARNVNKPVAFIAQFVVCSLTSH